MCMSQTNSNIISYENYSIYWLLILKYDSLDLDEVTNGYDNYDVPIFPKHSMRLYKLGNLGL